eukprot:COSAG05_NODE_915_length_6628_cov_1.974269_6_plen_222_part_00
MYAGAFHSSRASSKRTQQTGTARQQRSSRSDHRKSSSSSSSGAGCSVSTDASDVWDISSAAEIAAFRAFSCVSWPALSNRKSILVSFHAICASGGDRGFRRFRTESLDQARRLLAHHLGREVLVHGVHHVELERRLLTNNPTHQSVAMPLARPSPRASKHPRLQATDTAGDRPEVVLARVSCLNRMQEAGCAGSGALVQVQCSASSARPRQPLRTPALASG